MAKVQGLKPLAFEDAGAGLVKSAFRVKEKREQENKYSASQVYEAHNAIYGLQEKTELCTSCVVSRAKRVIEWVDGYAEWVDEQTIEAQRRKQAEEQRLAEGQVATPAKQKKQSKPSTDELADF